MNAMQSQFPLGEIRLEISVRLFQVKLARNRVYERQPQEHGIPRSSLLAISLRLNTLDLARQLSLGKFA
jgi:hypothetical protein